MSRRAAVHVAGVLRRVLAKGTARMAAATAASQIEFQRALIQMPDVSWADVELFQLDEYVGLPAAHPASFRGMLRDQLIDPLSLAHVHLIEDSDPERARARMSAAIGRQPLDLAVLGIGENAHLAFNDPPADFETTDPYIVVTLDEACRRQQVGEGWFATIDDVPTRAVTMSIRQMLGAREIVVIVPDRRKARAVRATLESGVDPNVPASILRTHSNVTVFLDEDAASELSTEIREKYSAGAPGL